MLPFFTIGDLCSRRASATLVTRSLSIPFPFFHQGLGRGSSRSTETPVLLEVGKTAQTNFTAAILLRTELQLRLLRG